MIQDLSNGRTVVVSPHLDDGVLSLGAAMASWVREGTPVELLTVFACDPGSTARAGGWDARAGFATEGEAARARREEDARACAGLGVAPRWLDFGDVDYQRHGDDDAVTGAILVALEGAERVLLPGFPLSHPDHAWLTRALLEASLPVCVGFYAEQPYALRSESSPELPGWVAESVGRAPAYRGNGSTLRERLSKWRAIREYRSQLPLLALDGRIRRGVAGLAIRDEEIAWVDGAAGRGRN